MRQLEEPVVHLATTPKPQQPTTEQLETTDVVQQSQLDAVLQRGTQISQPGKELETITASLWTQMPLSAHRSAMSVTVSTSYLDPKGLD